MDIEVPIIVDSNMELTMADNYIVDVPIVLNNVVEIEIEVSTYSTKNFNKDFQTKIIEDLLNVEAGATNGDALFYNASTEKWEPSDGASQAELEAHITNHDNPHEVTTTKLGLERVDNTNDLEKPISTLTQTALNLKYDSSDYATDWATLY